MKGRIRRSGGGGCGNDGAGDGLYSKCKTVLGEKEIIFSLPQVMEEEEEAAAESSFPLIFFFPASFFPVRCLILFPPRPPSILELGSSLSLSCQLQSAPLSFFPFLPANQPSLSLSEQRALPASLTLSVSAIANKVKIQLNETMERNDGRRFQGKGKKRVSAKEE